MNTQLKFGKQARERLKIGIDALSNAVSSTLGPKGHNVIIGYNEDTPKITKDGYTVAKSIHFEDVYANIGAQLLQEASSKTVNSAGDATTTTVVLASAMINYATNLLNSNSNSVLLQKGVRIAAEKIIEYIKINSIKVNEGDIFKIAKISANGDEEVANLVQEAFKMAKEDGIITVEESKDIHTTLKFTQGMQFERGYLAPHFITDNSKDTCVLENVHILITDQKVNTLADIAPALQPFVENKEGILLIASEFDDAVIQTLKINKLQGILNVCPIQAPIYGKYRNMMLEDIAIMTGGTVISFDSGYKLRDTTTEMLGKCKKVIVTKNDTTIIEGSGSEDTINTRVKELKSQLEEVKSHPEMDGSFMIDFLKQRIAKLSSGISVIYVGGTTELEMQEKKDRIDDAVCAARSAIEEGISIGGGLTFLNAISSIETIDAENNDINNGITLIAKSLKAPFETILSNCGWTKEQIKDAYDKISPTIGIDASKEDFVEMIPSGIIDPTKALRLAFENAVSICQLYLSINCVIIPEENIPKTRIIS